MKNCKKCGTVFIPSKGLKDYCSISCRNSRKWSESDKLKKSISAKNSDKVKNIHTNRTQEYWDKMGEVRKEKHKEKILNSNYDDLSFSSLRSRILYEQDEKCNRCGLNEWLNEPLTLELEHIDGDHFNNKRENLEMLCPNCHSLTLTWRGRNKKVEFNSNKKRVSDEKLLNELLLNEWNFRQALISVKLSPKGGNYKRCHKLKKEFEQINTMA